MIRSDLLMDCRYAEDQTTYETHFHNAYELIYVVLGCARITVGSSEYTASANSLVFINNREEHAVRIEEKPYHRYYAIFVPHETDRLIADQQLLSIFKNRPQSFRPCIKMPDPAGDPAIIDLVKLFRQMEQEFENPDVYSRDMEAACLHQIMIAAWRQAAGSFPVVESPMNEVVVAVQQYIDQHFTQNIRINDLAEQYFINPCYLAHRFKHLTGYSPKQYLLLNRLSQARQLLVNSNRPVAEVCLLAGFTDVNNFIRTFKAQMGMPPGQYRKLNR